MGMDTLRLPTLEIVKEAIVGLRLSRYYMVAEARERTSRVFRE